MHVYSSIVCILHIYSFNSLCLYVSIRSSCIFKIQLIMIYCWCFRCCCYDHLREESRCTRNCSAISLLHVIVWSVVVLQLMIVPFRKSFVPKSAIHHWQPNELGGWSRDHRGIVHFFPGSTEHRSPRHRHNPTERPFNTIVSFRRSFPNHPHVSPS